MHPITAAFITAAGLSIVVGFFAGVISMRIKSNDHLRALTYVVRVLLLTILMVSAFVGYLIALTAYWMRLRPQDGGMLPISGVYILPPATVSIILVIAFVTGMVFIQWRRRRSGV